MKVTEKEAAQLWCPHTRAPEVISPGKQLPANRAYSGAVLHSSRCIGSRCMMWRWHGSYPPITKLISENLSPNGPKKPDEVGPDWKWHPEHEGDPGCWEEPLAEACARAKGFCGLTTEGSHGHE